MVFSRFNGGEYIYSTYLASLMSKVQPSTTGELASTTEMIKCQSHDLQTLLFDHCFLAVQNELFEAKRQLDQNHLMASQCSELEAANTALARSAVSRHAISVRI